MRRNLIFKYLLISFLLLLISFVIVFHFWWRLKPSQDGLFFIVIAPCLMICWFGIAFMTIPIIRRTNFGDEDGFGFFTPFEMVRSGYFHEKIGIKKSRKLKTSFSLVAFPTLFFLIFSYYQIVDLYKNYQLKNYGKIKQIIINDSIQHKSLMLRGFEFEYQNEKISKLLVTEDSLKIGDKSEIIFSKKNPHVVEWKNKFLNND